MVTLSKEEWVKTIRDQEQSRMSVYRYCQLHGLSDKTFYNKKRLLKDELKKPELVEVGIQEDCIMLEKKHIRFKVNGMQFEFDTNSSDEDIRRIIKVCLSL